jgi:hypothetical protein
MFERRRDEMKQVIKIVRTIDYADEFSKISKKKFSQPWIKRFASSASWIGGYFSISNKLLDDSEIKQFGGCQAIATILPHD